MTFQVRCFHAGDGDCLLLSAGDDDALTHMLVDGGRSGPFAKQTAPFLYDNDDIPSLDLVVVSHIDNDHISGVLRLLKDHVAHTVWKVKKEGGRTSGMSRTEPDRPPEINKLWHNSVTDALGEKVDQTVAQQSLATSAALLGGQFAGEAEQELGLAATRMDNLATGHRSAIELEGRLRGKLNIETEKELILVPEGDKARRSRRRVGAFSITVIGPTEERIKDLRKDWEKWIDDNEQARLDVMERLRDDEQEMGAFSPSSVAPDSLAQGSSGGNITVPNLASLMLLVRAEDKSILLTGDGSSEDILEGLDRSGVDDRHFDVVKIPHHGATANVSHEFCREVTADTYVFCGNGAHTNPELEVLWRIANARLADGACQNQPFTFAFTSKSSTPGLSERRHDHMKEVEGTVRVLEQFVDEHPIDPDSDSSPEPAVLLKMLKEFVEDTDRHKRIRNRRLRYEFLKEGHLTLDL
ncbi:MAG: MBL fold metallo-hydrolase [Actinomycetota bacterium]